MGHGHEGLGGFLHPVEELDHFVCCTELPVRSEILSKLENT